MINQKTKVLIHIIAENNSPDSHRLRIYFKLILCKRSDVFFFPLITHADLGTALTTVGLTAAINSSVSTQVLIRPPSPGSPALGIVRHTSGLTADVRQTRQTTGKFSETTVGEKLVDGSGFAHSPSGNQRHGPEQSAAASAEGAQDLRFIPCLC